MENLKPKSTVDDVLSYRWEFDSPIVDSAAINPNTETDLFGPNSRIANLEAACFPGGLNNGSLSPVFQGATTPPSKVYSGTQDALSYPGVAVFSSTTVDAATLATPVVTTDDFKTLLIVDAGGASHTVTTATNKIVSGSTQAHKTLTFNGNQGASVLLRAYQGLWYVEQISTAPAGVVIS
jgi:hypothetical protein